MCFLVQNGCGIQEIITISVENVSLEINGGCLQSDCNPIDIGHMCNTVFRGTHLHEI